MAKILVVDDELAFRESMHHAFSKKGHEVMTAMNADHAMNLIASHTFDLIVLDVVMPGEPGDVFLRNIRAAQNPVPVVIYSVRIDADLEKEMRKAGANEVLNKAVSLEVLTDRSEKVLQSAGRPLVGTGAAKKRLLVVDDEKFIRQMLIVFFGKKGYAVSRVDAPGVQARRHREALMVKFVIGPSLVLKNQCRAGRMFEPGVFEKLGESHGYIVTLSVAASKVFV